MRGSTFFRNIFGQSKTECRKNGTQGIGTVKYYAQIRLQIWQNSVCTGQGNLPLIIQ